MQNRRTILPVAALAIAGASAMVVLWKATEPPSPAPDTALEASGSSPGASTPTMPDNLLSPSSDTPAAGFPPLQRFDEQLELDFAARIATGARETDAATVVSSFIDEQLVIWQMTLPDQRGPALARSMNDFAQRAMAQHGNDAWEDAGAELAQRFAEALATAVASCAPAAEAQQAWACMVDSSATWHRDAVGIGGDFIEFAFRTGLLTADSGLTVSIPMLRAIFLYRWFNAVTGVRPVEQSLTPSEYRAFLRWRIEHATGIAATRRHELAIAYATAFPDESSPPNADTLALTAAAAGVDPPVMTTEE